jgi:hypothetical protein
MDDPTTTATLDQADEDILTYTASDEALEAAAGTERGQQYTPNTNIVNCSLSPGQCCADGRARSRSIARMLNPGLRLANSFEYEE